MPRHPLRVIEIVAFDGVQLLDVTGPYQVFATANDVRAGTGLGPAYAPRVVSTGAGLRACSGGLSFAVACPSPGRIDTLIVAGGAGVRAASREAEKIAWLAGRIGDAGRVASVCTGAFLLAATGALDGRRVVTHWAHCASLAARFPRLRVDPNPIFIRDGDIWTSAGVTAGIDLALAMVEADLGHATALAVARQLVVFVKRPGGQSQFSDTLAHQMDATKFDALVGWMADNLRRDLSVPALAQRAGMSERSLLRHWRSATGTTPARTVERLRVEAARRALASTRQPLKRVAENCGFGTAETMRRSFQKLLAVSPQNWRERFVAGVAR